MSTRPDWGAAVMGIAGRLVVRLETGIGAGLLEAVVLEPGSRAKRIMIAMLMRLVVGVAPRVGVGVARNTLVPGYRRMGEEKGWSGVKDAP